ncbi:hypothetical protein D3C81_1808830 [compost metagenome]
MGRSGKAGVPCPTPQIEQAGIGTACQQLGQALQVFPLRVYRTGQVGIGLFAKLAVDRIFMAVADAHSCSHYYLAYAGAEMAGNDYNQAAIRVQYEQLS